MQTVNCGKAYVQEIITPRIPFLPEYKAGGFINSSLEKFEGSSYNHLQMSTCSVKVFS
jgi:hypothetical protein